MEHFIDRGKPRSPAVLEERAKTNGEAVAFTCKRCGAHVLTWRMRDVKAQPRTFEALSRQASQKHEAVCPNKEAQ